MFDAYWQRAQVSIAMDSLEKAIDDMNLYIANISDQKILGNAYYQRALIMEKAGCKSDCCSDLQSSCDLNFPKAFDTYRLKCH